ncbi:MAG: hypothetical protein QOF78_4410 [Phycisphaerales bacterium]|nr:hypothetical protein [Phycisphaerales bacterium]
MMHFCASILMIAAASASPTTMPAVGVEGRIELALPGTLLQAKPVTDKAPLLLRVASTQPSARRDDLWYDLRYMGLVPGTHDLKDYLVRADGSPIGELPSIPVAVVGLLPQDHKGELVGASGARWPFFGGYRVAIGVVAVLWCAVLFPLIFIGRKKRIKTDAPPPARATFADRLRPLIDQAVRGTLSTEEKGKLERMLLWYWQQRLDLTADSPADAIAALRRHEKAGELLRALEEWLHRRPGTATATDVNALLAPYRDVPDPGEVRAPAALAAGGVA